MWISDAWKDYELIDCGRGEKLERWGKHLLVRPDPQAIWNTPRRHPGWKKHEARYSRSSTGGGAWEKKELPERWTVGYRDLTFNIKPMNFKHTGLFPEQAANWDWAREQIRRAGRPIQVLNLFAYTGGATVACAAAGAAVCHVDAAKGMVSWAKENARSSGLEEAPIRWIIDDCGKFVERENPPGPAVRRHHHGPPLLRPGSFRGRFWKLEENLYPFVELVSGVLSDNPLFVIINSYTTGLAPSVLTYILETIVSSKHGGRTDSQELGLRVSETGLALPCGATGRWLADR